MNWKYYLGSSLHRAELKLIKFNNGFIRRNFPYGRHWLFDLHRILSKAPRLIIDAGANIGSISLDAREWFPEAEIYAFEPVSSTFDQLKRNTSAYANIHPFQLALGDENTTSFIVLQGEHTINSLKTVAAEDADREKISLARLDDFLMERNLTTVDILKIDVEGYEFEVLKGCGGMLGGAIKCILLEVGYEREPGKVHFSDVDQLMEAHDYQLCGIYETRRNLYDKRKLWYSNNLYIQKSLLKN